jgi:hypothetical protein
MSSKEELRITFTKKRLNSKFKRVYLAERAVKNGSEIGSGKGL